ncbi:thioredoxin domain-containing protein, partial [Gemmatimonadota bacterium]
LAWGMIELYQTTFEVIWLDRACELVTGMIERFADPDLGGFYMTPSDGEQLLVRSKEIYDGAVASGNSVACSVLVRLARITGRLDWEDEAHRLVGAFGERIAAAPSAHTHLMSALDFLEGPSIEIVLAGDPDSDDLQAMLRTIRSSYVPNCVVLLRPEPQEDPAVAGPAPWVRDQRSVDGRATAYVCRDRACDLPIHDADALREALQKPMPPR